MRLSGRRRTRHPLPVAPAFLVTMGDRELIQIVDAAMAEAARKSGAWLVCRPGCYSCCVGLFPISQVDAARLQQGLTDLAATDPARAVRVRQRAQAAANQIAGASLQ